MAKFTPSNTATPDLDVDDGTLSVDEANNRVGVGTTDPKTKLTVEGTVTVKEQANADGDTAAYGQLWVKSNAPCDLFFTDDTGQDVRLTNDGSLAAPPSAGAVAADDITAGDASVTLTGGSGDAVTINATAAQAQLKTTTSGEVDITSAANIDINAVTGIAVDATTVSIDGTDDSNITVTASAKDLDIAVAGGGTQELRLASAGTGASALHLNASAGGINIDSADMIDIDAADEITVTTTSADGHISLVSAHTAGVALHIDADANAGSIVDIDAGILDIDVTGAATIDAASLTVTADTATFTSANADDPLLQLKNTTNDASGARLQFVKDKGAAGADGDDIGVIEFVGDDAAQTQTTFAKIVAEVSEADDTDEAGKLSFFVAESDGTTTTLTAGLVLEGEHATDGEVDVTIGAGAASTTTIAGNLAVTTIPAAVADVAADEILMLDADGSIKRETIADLASSMAGYGLSHASGQLTLYFAETGGVTLTSSDSIMILDNGTATKRITVSGHGTYLAGAGLASTSGVLAVEAAQAITSVTADLTVAGGDLILGATAVAGTVSGVAAAADTAGNAVTIQGGSALAGNSANTGVGGAVVIQGGAGKGTAAGGSIVFKSATAGDSGTALNSINDTILTLASDLSAVFAGAVDIDGALTVDGAGVSIDSAGVAANFTVASDGAGEDLTIGLTGATDSSIVISSTGTGADAINIDTTAGSIDIDSADNITVDAADEISISTTSADGHITLASAHTAGVALHIDANANAGSIVDIDAGILDIDVTAAATIDAVGIALGAGSGELDLTTTGVMDINSAALDIDTSGAITIDAAGVASHIAIVTAHTAGQAFHLDADANAGSIVDIDAGILDIDVTAAATIDAVGIALGAGSGELDLTTTGVMDINSAALDIDTSGAITIDAAGVASHIAIVTAHTAGQAFHLDADANAGSIVDIDAGILDIDVTGAATIDAASLTVTADTATFTSANADDPLLQLKNTTNDASGARLQFVKDKGAAGADGDDIGVIEFVGDDAAQTQMTFAKIVAEVSEADDTDEAGKLSLFVAESDGTTTALAAGLVLEGEHATNGQVDATIGAGVASLTTASGLMHAASGFTIGAVDIYGANSSSQAVGVAGLTIVTTSGTNGAADTYTLAAGTVIGQIKKMTLTMKGSDACTLEVTDSSWGSSNLATFAAHNATVELCWIDLGAGAGAQWQIIFFSNVTFS